MALESVEIALLVLVFAPVLTGLAVLDLMNRIDLTVDEVTPAHLWCGAVTFVPFVGAALYFWHGRQDVDQLVAERRRAARVATNAGALT